MARNLAGPLPLLGLALAAGVPRALGTYARQPWHDEYFTHWVTQLPLGELLAALRLDSGPPLFYLLAKLVTLLGPSPLVSARLVALFAGTAAVLLASLAARRAFGPDAGWWCGVLLAVHPLAIAWSCEGRSYGLLFLAVAWSWERLETVAASGRGHWWLGTALGLACWSHSLGLVWAAAAALATFTLPSQRRRPALMGVAAGLASHLPWLPVAAAQPAAAIAWMGRDWAARGLTETIIAPVRHLPLTGSLSQHLDLPPVPPAVELLGAILCVVVLTGSKLAPRPIVLVALPVLSLSLLVWLGVPVFFPGRSEATYLAAFTAVLASGAVNGRWRARAATALLVGGVTLAVLAIVAWRREPPRLEQLIAAAVQTNLPEGGVVVVGGHWRLGVSYHLPETVDEVTFLSFPAAAAHHPGWYNDATQRIAPGELTALRQRLEHELRGERGVAVIVAKNLATSSPLTQLSRELGLSPRFQTPFVAVWAGRWR